MSLTISSNTRLLSSSPPAIQPSLLCQTCRDIFRGSKSSGEYGLINKTYYDHHRIEALQQSIKEGCQLCKILRGSLQYEEDGAVFERVLKRNFYGSYYIGGDSKDATFQLRFHYDLGREGREDKFYAPGYKLGDEAEFISIDMLDCKQLNTFKFAPAISNSTSSNASLKTALAWLRTCNETHPFCKRSISSQPKLPTRLLEIGESPILRESSTLHPETSYITLSHCWGAEKITMLTQSTLRAFMEGRIPIGYFPSTFQHAISFCKALGIRYIWIDSLCIIQDSRQDWIQESSQMGEVYSRSFCNLAATASSNGSGGLFRDQSAYSTRPCIANVTWDLSEKGYYFCYATNIWEYEVANAPLNRRAWVLQERLLPPRILHFAASQLYWECEELCASETYPQGLPGSIRRHRIKEGWSLRKLASLSLTPDSSAKYYKVWKSCVEQFSNCRLSIESDKLVALSGVARLISHGLAPENTYLAGLWKSKLTRHLLWHFTWNTIGRRSKLFRAPSWSWACLDGDLSFPDASNGSLSTDLITILFASTIHIDDPFGQVSGGIIRMQGKMLFRVLLSHIERSESWLSLHPRIKEFPVIYVDAYADEPMHVTRNPSHDFHCFGIRRYNGPRGYGLVEGLILQPTGKVKGQFQRVGYFHVNGGHPENFLASDRFRLPVDADLVYEEKNDNDSYTISIV